MGIFPWCNWNYYCGSQTKRLSRRSKYEKKGKLLTLVIISLISLTGCGKCAIDGCEEKVYEDGICLDHTIEEIDRSVEEVMRIDAEYKAKIGFLESLLGE